MNRFFQKTDQKGFSLLELVLVIGVMSIVMAGILNVFHNSARFSNANQVSGRVQQSLRFAMNALTQDLVTAGYDPTGAAIEPTAEASNPAEDNRAGMHSAGTTWVWFSRDLNSDGDVTDANESLAYYWSGSQILLVNDLYGTSYTESLLDNVTGFTLTFFDNSDPPIDLGSPVSTANLTSIRQVEISITVLENAGTAGGVSRTMTSRITCKNLGIN